MAGGKNPKSQVKTNPKAAQPAGDTPMTDPAAHDVDVLSGKHLPGGWQAKFKELAADVAEIKKTVTEIQDKVDDIAGIKTAVGEIAKKVDEIATQVAAIPRPPTPVDEAVEQVKQWTAKLDGLLEKLRAVQATTDEQRARVTSAIAECGVVKTALAELTPTKLKQLYDAGILEDTLDKLKARLMKAAVGATAALDDSPVVVTPGLPRRTATTAAEAGLVAADWSELVTKARQAIVDKAATLPKSERVGLNVVADNCTTHLGTLRRFADDASRQSRERIAESTASVVSFTESLVRNAYGAIGRSPPPM